MAKYDGNDIGLSVYSSDIAIPPTPYNGNYIFSFASTATVAATPVPSSLAPSSSHGGKVFEVRS